MPILKPIRGIQLNRAHPLARGIVGCWLFNEAGGNTIYDISRRGLNLSEGGTPVWVPGQNGWAVEYDDASSEYHEIDSTPIVSTATPFTIACLFYSDDITHNQALVCISDKDSEIKYCTLMAGGQETGDPVIAETTGVYATAARTTRQYSANTWHHACGVWAASNDRRAYIDGGSKGTNNFDRGKSGFDRLSIGRIGDSSPSSYFSGRIAAVWIWNRILTDGEVAWHARESFCMFEPGPSPAVLYVPVGSTVDFDGTISAQSAVSGTTKVGRELVGSVDASTTTTATAKINKKVSASCAFATDVAASLSMTCNFAAELQSSANLIGSLTLTGEVGLEGTISAAFSLTGKLSLVTAGKWFAGSLKTERKWLIDALFAGTTANAFKLGTVLSCGWFWMRRLECSVLYRGLSMDTVDFANILAVAEHNDNTISPPDYILHKSGSSYFYLVRRFNGCGYQECTLTAAFKIAINVDGELIKPQPNKVFTSTAKQISGNKVQLLWFYCPIEQKSQPAHFNIYCDNKTGQINYQEPLTTISYQGRRFYSFNSDMFEADKYLFAVRPIDSAMIENSSLARVGIQLDAAGPDAIGILNAETD